METVVIVGASLAGVQAAQALRRADFEGNIVMVGDEAHTPYDRPPLSKKYLSGAWEADKIVLRAAADPEALGIDWRLGVRATGLDLEQRLVHTGDTSIAFDGLVIATGARARSLPGGELGGVHVLRTLDDATGLRDAFAAGPSRVVVIGAGFIGAEVASTARGLDLRVTMIEAAKAPLDRVLDSATGEAISDLHSSNGVDVRCGVGVSALIPGDDGTSVASVELSDGTTIEADCVVIGIGVIPNTEWLEGSGLTLDNGVVCDETCAAAPGVVAAGDIARWPNPRYDGALTRVEQWDNAIDQGSHAAKTLLAWADGNRGEAFGPVPWFWSDQFDRKMMLAGIPGPQTEVVHGSIESREFVQLYLNDAGDVVGALGWNRPRHTNQARQLLTDRASIDEFRELLA